MAEPLGYALLGCGAFGRFSMENYTKLDDVRLIAVADCHNERGLKTAEKFGLQAYESERELFSRDDVDLVHIATPPGTHHDLVLQALDAGKHVLCEKPLATTVDDGRAMLEAAKQAKRVLAVNLIMRYNPLCLAIEQVVRNNLLGEPIHAFMENYAQDQRFGPDHWFWRPEMSGGIFIEHGVHFFDLFGSWFGPGQVLSAQHMSRPGSPDVVEQVQCLCRYGQSALVSFYHGFHQSERMDRQEFRIVCERGDLRLFEWLPTTARIDATLLDADVERIAGHLPNAHVKQITRYSGDQRRVSSRHKHYEVDGLFSIESHVGMTKNELYGKVLRDLLADQIKFIFDPSHKRIVDEQAGLKSLEMAEQATRLASDVARARRP